MIQVVLAGVVGDLDWQVEMSNRPGHTSTFIFFRRGPKHAGNMGFEGPALYPGRLTNVLWGQADESPRFVVARVHPTVDRVVVPWSDRPAIEAMMTDVLPECGVKVAVALASEGWPTDFRAYVDDRLVN